MYARDCTRKPCQDEPLGVIARTENRISVRWKDIAPTMRSATVAVEDRRYWEHGALDWHGIARAALNNLQAGGIRQGGSTISQQLAKNLYLLREASSRSLSRKIDEAWIAVQLEDKYTKAEILTAYLNTVFYGESAYGVEAAAHTFFDKTAKQLTLAQSALLAGLPQAPERLQPVRAPGRRDEAPGRGARRHARAPLDQRGCVREGEQRAARPQARELRNAVVLALRVRPGAAGAERAAAGQARGPRRSARLLDGRPAPAVRGAAGDQGRAQVARRSSAALVAINVHNGNVLALGTSDYGSSKNQFNLATAGHRSPGSTFKLFALVEALRRGADPVAGRTTRRGTSRSPRTTRSARSPAAGRRTTPSGGGGYRASRARRSTRSTSSTPS